MYFLVTRGDFILLGDVFCVHRQVHCEYVERIWLLLFYFCAHHRITSLCFLSRVVCGNFRIFGGLLHYNVVLLGWALYS